MFKISNNTIISFSPKHLKVFLGTLSTVFIVVAMQLSDLWPSKIEFPIPLEKDIFYDDVLNKLELKQNNFKINKKNNFIPEAFAGADYEAASAYALVDYDSGEVIISKNLDKKLAIASITKVMTSVIALDLANKDDRFIVSDNASKMIPTKIGVVPNETLTLSELLNATLLTSANDAAEVIKEGIDAKYSEPVFIKAMNEKAKIIGMNNTSFTNPQGFDDSNHKSSVSDVALLTHYAMQNYPEIRDIVLKNYALLPKDDYHKQFDLFNWNGLIDVYPGVLGMKIGYTENAGRTTTVVAERGGKKLIAVVLGAPGIIERDLWTAELLDFGFQKKQGLSKIEVTEEQLRNKYASWSYWN